MPVSIFLSFDSLIVGLLVAMCGMAPARQRRLCAAFAICDGWATFTGLSMHSPFAAALACALGAALAAIVARSRWRGVLWVPALFSLDNLLSGMAAKAGNGSDILAGALMAALGSGLLAVIGMTMGTALLRRGSRQWVTLTGLLMLVAAMTA